MAVYPLTKESQSIHALQDFGRDVGIPHTIKTDNARSEIGLKWTKWCRNFCTKSITTEPHHPWQNLAEQGIGDLGRMVRRCMAEFGAPLSRHSWCQKWCVDIRNHLASSKLNWRTPKEKLTGNTPDISVFRFHFWEPIWFYNPQIKTPRNRMQKGRFLGVAWNAGDELTYYIETEKSRDHERGEVLIRSVIITRRKNIGTSQECVSESDNMNNIDLQFENQPLGNIDTNSKSQKSGTNVNDDTTEMEGQDNTSDDSDNDTSDEDSEDVNIDPRDIYNMFESNDGEIQIEKIISYEWIDGVLTFKVQLETGTQFTIPFNIIKKDNPILVAKYIREHVIEISRREFYGKWAHRILKQNKIVQRRTMGNNQHIVSRNQRNDNIINHEKYGIQIPKTVQQAFQLDMENGNQLWNQAIKKEMEALHNAGVWEYHPPHFKHTSDYQFAPLRIIFDVKKDDLRRKARMVAGGHKVDATMWEAYASTVEGISIRLLMTIGLHNKLTMVTGDIGNDFIHAKTNEKIWAKAGPEFDERQGCILTIKKALYGLNTSGHQWSKCLGDKLRSMGFTTTRSDPDVWIIKSTNHFGYDYIAIHVDDLIIMAMKPLKYLEILKEDFTIRNIEENPSRYLGNDYNPMDNKIKVSCMSYINEILRKYQVDYGDLRSEKTPAMTNDHPESDQTPTLDENGIKHYQRIIGICQWLVTSGHYDINFAVASLSRFSVEPREGHLKRAIKILGYLKKFPTRGYIVDPSPPEVNIKYDKIVPDFGNQYQDFSEEIDGSLPIPLFPELEINIFVDSDHGHDAVTGKSITGLISFVGKTPIYWCSKRQPAVQTSTFGAEFMALRKAVERQ